MTDETIETLLGASVDAAKRVLSEIYWTQALVWFTAALLLWLDGHDRYSVACAVFGVLRTISSIEAVAE